MSDSIERNISALNNFLQEKGWAIFNQNDIEHGRQVIVTDGSVCLPVNFYHTGKILVQGKTSEMKTALTEWANLHQAGLGSELEDAFARQNRVAKYLVIPDNIERIYRVIQELPGEVIQKETKGPAELSRTEARYEQYRVTITQYKSGTLIVQGLSSPYFDKVCEILDEHLTQSFSDRAARYIVGEAGRAAATAYLEQPEAENEALEWILQQIGEDVLNFLYENDKRTLLAAVGVRNAFKSANQFLPDYSVVVMPFAKAIEGFLVRLAVHLGLTTEDALKQKASEIEIGNWLSTIEDRLPDKKRYGDIHSSLNAAWQCRNKALHSDFVNPLSTLQSFNEAEQEIATILRAMKRAHRVLVVEGVQLSSSSPSDKEHDLPEFQTQKYTYTQVNREYLRKQLETNGYPVSVQPEGKRNAWEVLQKPELMVFAPRDQEGLIIIKGNKSKEFCKKYEEILTGRSPRLNQTMPMARIGVDESGKGDVFGPLVVAGVILSPDIEKELARQGVRDSKTLSDKQILQLAEEIRKNCPVEVLVLKPPEYNNAYEKYGRNLNRLLAWAHAQIISKLCQGREVSKALSDQFGDKSLLVEALEVEGCQIPLEQRPRAESDLAVAAASIIARSEFINVMEEYTRKADVRIPLGASAREVKEIGKFIYQRWGRKGLERVAKMHFKTIQEIISEVNQ